MRDSLWIERFKSLKRTNLTQIPDWVYLWSGKVISKSKMAGMCSWQIFVGPIMNDLKEVIREEEDLQFFSFLFPNMDTGDW